MSFPDYIYAVEQGYREIGQGHGMNFPRENLWIPGDADQTVRGGHLPAGSKASFKFKAALLPGLGGAGVQAYTAGLPKGLETYLFLFDANTGGLAAIMEVLYYDWLKTAATAAVAAKYIAPEDSQVVALIGTGRHARTQLHALCAVRPIRKVLAYSRDAQKRSAFCERMAAELGIDVQPVDTPEAALAEADIVTTITTSPAPVFDGHALPDKPLHINAMGAHYAWVREIDAHAVINSRVFVDEREQAMQEQGEVLIPIKEGLIDESHVIGDLGQVVTRQVEVRPPGTRWTLFLSGGTGTEDVAVATRLYEAAREKGIGTEFAFNQPYEFEL